MDEHVARAGFAHLGEGSAGWSSSGDRSRAGSGRKFGDNQTQVEHFDYTTPFLYAVGAYLFFHWLDENASPEGHLVSYLLRPAATGVHFAFKSASPGAAVPLVGCPEPVIATSKVALC
jgi:hypothetical protein